LKHQFLQFIIKTKNMRNYIIFLITAVILTSCTEPAAEKTGPESFVFPHTEYTKVVAYHFEDLNGGHIIDKNGKLNQTVKKEKTLNASEVASFLEMINSHETYGGTYTRCFRPRLGFVFYDENNKTTAHISICFECSQQMSKPLVKAYADASHGQHGYSDKGFMDLTGFCKRLGFGQCGE
jgi:hypothetical protein